MTDFLISFKTDRKPVRGSKRVTCHSMIEAQRLGKVLNASIGASCIEIRKVVA